MFWWFQKKKNIINSSIKLLNSFLFSTRKPLRSYKKNKDPPKTNPVRAIQTELGLFSGPKLFNFGTTMLMTWLVFSPFLRFSQIRELKCYSRSYGCLKRYFYFYPALTEIVSCWVGSLSVLFLVLFFWYFVKLTNHTFWEREYVVEWNKSQYYDFSRQRICELGGIGTFFSVKLKSPIFVFFVFLLVSFFPTFRCCCVSCRTHPHSLLFFVSVSVKNPFPLHYPQCPNMIMWGKNQITNLFVNK